MSMDLDSKLLDLFNTLENANRAKILLGVYLAGKTDLNTANDIETIVNTLYEGELSLASIRSNLNKLDETGLILKESAQITSSTTSNFYSITDLGRIGLIYLHFITLGPIEIKNEEQIAKIIKSQDFRQIVNNLLEEGYGDIKSIKKFVKKSLQVKKEKIGQISVEDVNFDPPKLFSTKEPIRIHIYEHLIKEHIDVAFGLTSEAISSNLAIQGTATSHLNKLEPLLDISSEGKKKFYRLSRLGVYVILPLSWFHAIITSGNSSALSKLFFEISNPTEDIFTSLIRKSLEYLKLEL